MQHKQGHEPRRRTRSVERRSPHGRLSYCVNTCGWSVLEPRHHHAPRTRRHRRYAGSGKLNVIAALMAPCHSHAACQPPGEVRSSSKLLGRRAFDHRGDIGRVDTPAWLMRTFEQNCMETDNDLACESSIPHRSKRSRVAWRVQVAGCVPLASNRATPGVDHHHRSDRRRERPGAGAGVYRQHDRQHRLYGSPIRQLPTAHNGDAPRQRHSQ